MNNLIKIRKELFLLTIEQREIAWNTKNYEKSIKIREKEKINYEKWKLVDGIIKQNEKERKNDKNRKK